MCADLKHADRRGCRIRELRTIDGTVLDVRSVSVRYGLSVRSIRGHVARRTMPFRKFGGRIIFLKDELDAWFTQLDGCSLAEAKENLGRRQGEP